MCYNVLLSSKDVRGHMEMSEEAQRCQGDSGVRESLSPAWPSGLKRRNPTVPVVRTRFEPRCGRPHFAPTHNDLRVSVAGTAQRPESVSGRRGPCPAYRARQTFGWNSAIALELRDRVVGPEPAQQAMLSEGSDPAYPPYQPFEPNKKNQQCR